MFRNLFNTKNLAAMPQGVNALSNINFSAAIAFITALSSEQPDKNILFLVPDDKFADRTFFELNLFASAVPLPLIQSEKYKTIISGTLNKIINKGKKNKIIVCQYPIIEMKFPELKELVNSSLILNKDSDYDVKNIINYLSANNYDRVDIVREQNSYALRGGIIDIFPSEFSMPVRCDFFGDTLSSIRSFDCANQRSVSELETIEIFPFFDSMKKTDGITSYLNAGDMIISYEPILCEKNFNGNIDAINKFKEKYLSFDLMLLQDNTYKNCFNFQIDSNIMFNTQNAAQLFKNIDKTRKISIVTAQFDAQIERISKLLDSNKILHSRCAFEEIDLNLKKGFYLIKSNLIEPFEFKKEEIIVIPEGSISSGRHIKNTSHLLENESTPIDSFTELDENDYIVHVDYGIGIYKKIETMDVEGISVDFLVIQYADEGVLYLPVDQLNKIQKYIGGGDGLPALYRLGGSAWQKIKLKAKKEIGNVARELVELYARREISKGVAFGKDVPWQFEFEEEFSWEETRDQLKAIADVKKDMESEKTMDRLICGDVGYGKTEVALRAIFKCLMSGYQAAVLTPTTILTQQHFQTFKDRMSNYPFKVEALSRFRSKAEQREILKKLKSGELDVVIGTHRLIQSDVKFKNLGLLVIDEEQRFGVKHKEKIKKMKTNVDVLSMTATPIPRTLHLSLIGVRDISVIATPPKGRIPIEVIVSEENDEIIRQAIDDELKRDGQIYIIHNRIESIKTVENNLLRIFPKLRIAILHGQMDTDIIEETMVDFIQKKYDALLATTIIENGLDIPNVNTLIITDADKFGLAQMYQIKGRIGRTTKQAFAYFLHKGQSNLSAIAKKRLSMIALHKELGAGFKIAMNDLEIRGAGNIIGTEQHGIIMDIGYELYCKLLVEMIKYIQKNNIMPSDEFNFSEEMITINTNKSCYIPEDYIKDSKTKIEIYKKLSYCYELKTLKNIIDEINDRFGKPPVQMLNLITAVELKIFAFENKISEIIFSEKNIKFSVKDDILKNKIFKFGYEFEKDRNNPSSFFLKCAYSFDTQIETLKQLIRKYRMLPVDM